MIFFQSTVFLFLCFHLCSSFVNKFDAINLFDKKYTGARTFHLLGVKKSSVNNEATTKGFVGSAKSTASSALHPAKDSQSSQKSPLQNDIDFSKLRSSAVIEDYCPNFNHNFPGIRRIHVDPPIFEVDNFFPIDLCEDMIQRANDKGIQVASQTFSPLTSTKRTSTTWYLPYGEVPEFLDKANQLTGFPILNFEEPQIVRYEMGQQFSWHYDSIPKSILDNSGQRVATLLVYLKTVDQGGATAFKDLNLKVQPIQGKALLFFPCFADGTPDERTMHAGQIALDTKWIAQM